jgi:DNA-binding response OmpR family regulator
MTALRGAEGRVLLVEDEAGLLETYAGQLGSAGFDVAKAQTAAEAVRVLDKGGFDVVLSDFDLPDESGLEVARRARELKADVAVILWSAKQVSDKVRRLMADSGFGYILKPVEPVALCRATIRALRQRDGRLFDNRNGDEVVLAAFQATDVKNRFTDVLEAALRDGAAVIQKHRSTKAVLLSWDEYVDLTDARRDKLQHLTAKFDGLLAKMQTVEFARAARSAFEATPAELGAAAAEAARTKR